MAAPLFPQAQPEPVRRPQPTLPQLRALALTLTTARDDIELQARLSNAAWSVANAVQAIDRALALVESELADLEEAECRLAVVDGLTTDSLPVKPASIYSAEAQRRAAEEEEMVRQAARVDTAELAQLYPDLARDLDRCESEF
jgi:hypothetical protein